MAIKVFLTDMLIQLIYTDLKLVYGFASSPTLIRHPGSFHWAPLIHFRSHPGRSSLRAFTRLRRKLLTHLLVVNFARLSFTENHFGFSIALSKANKNNPKDLLRKAKRTLLEIGFHYRKVLRR